MTVLAENLHLLNHNLDYAVGKLAVISITGKEKRALLNKQADGEWYTPLTDLWHSARTNVIDPLINSATDRALEPHKENLVKALKWGLGGAAVGGGIGAASEYLSPSRRKRPLSALLSGGMIGGTLGGAGSLLHSYLPQVGSNPQGTQAELQHNNAIVNRRIREHADAGPYSTSSLRVGDEFGTTRGNISELSSSPWGSQAQQEIAARFGRERQSFTLDPNNESHRSLRNGLRSVAEQQLLAQGIPEAELANLHDPARRTEFLASLAQRRNGDLPIRRQISDSRNSNQTIPVDWTAEGLNEDLNRFSFNQPNREALNRVLSAMHSRANQANMVTPTQRHLADLGSTGRHLSEFSPIPAANDTVGRLGLHTGLTSYNARNQGLPQLLSRTLSGRNITPEQSTQLRQMFGSDLTPQQIEQANQIFNAGTITPEQHQQLQQIFGSSITPANYDQLRQLTSLGGIQDPLRILEANRISPDRLRSVIRQLSHNPTAGETENNRREEQITNLLNGDNGLIQRARGHVGDNNVFDDVAQWAPSTGNASLDTYLLARGVPGIANFGRDILNVTRGTNIGDLRWTAFHHPERLNLSPSQRAYLQFVARDHWNEFSQIQTNPTAFMEQFRATEEGRNIPDATPAVTSPYAELAQVHERARLNAAEQMQTNANTPNIRTAARQLGLQLNNQQGPAVPHPLVTNLHEQVRNRLSGSISSIINQLNNGTINEAQANSYLNDVLTAERTRPGGGTSTADMLARVFSEGNTSNVPVGAPEVHTQLTTILNNPATLRELFPGNEPVVQELLRRPMTERVGIIQEAVARASRGEGGSHPLRTASGGTLELPPIGDLSANAGWQRLLGRRFAADGKPTGAFRNFLLSFAGASRNPNGLFPATGRVARTAGTIAPLMLVEHMLNRGQPQASEFGELIRPTAQVPRR